MKTIINNFKPLGGYHCITNSLKQIFEYYNHPLSEEMLFGIGEGLDFTYINMKNSPLVSGRSKVIDFEKTIGLRLGIKLTFQKNKDYERVFESTKKMIQSDDPVLVYVDMPFLSYFNMNSNSHFGGHAIILFGYDDETEHFYVSDRDNDNYPINTPTGSIQNDFHLVKYSEMQQARSSSYRPFPANNKSIRFDFSNYTGINKDVIKTAIINTCAKMLNSPATLKGITGIEKFGLQLKKWDKFETEKIKMAGLTNYFQINGDGGTGGGIFRKLYGNFLIEASIILENEITKEIGNDFVSLAQRWDNVSTMMWELFETGNHELLGAISDIILDLYEKEKNFLEKLQVEVAEIS